MGKTTPALGMIKKMLDSGDGVIFFRLEMPNHQLTNRLVSISISIELHKIRSGKITQEEEKKFLVSAKELKPSILSLMIIPQSVSIS